MVGWLILKEQKSYLITKKVDSVFVVMDGSDDYDVGWLVVGGCGGDVGLVGWRFLLFCSVCYTTQAGFFFYGSFVFNINVTERNYI